MIPGDRARVTTFVRVDPATAFEVFTAETDLWWKRGPRYRFGGARRGTLRFEAGPDGRLFEAFDEGEVFEVGRVRVWEPGARLVFEWRIRNFQPGERTEVEVLFEAAEGGTRVIVEHRGFSALPKDHPVRHGLTGSAFTAMIGLWWGDLATGLRAYVANRPAP
jgi:uncharacterized protein YndB with AHSA1/START domain